MHAQHLRAQLLIGLLTGRQHLLAYLPTCPRYMNAIRFNFMLQRVCHLDHTTRLMNLHLQGGGKSTRG